MLDHTVPVLQVAAVGLDDVVDRVRVRDKLLGERLGLLGALPAPRAEDAAAAGPGELVDAAAELVAVPRHELVHLLLHVLQLLGRNLFRRAVEVATSVDSVLLVKEDL